MEEAGELSVHVWEPLSGGGGEEMGSSGSHDTLEPVVTLAFSTCVALPKRPQIDAVTGRAGRVSYAFPMCLACPALQ